MEALSVSVWGRKGCAWYLDTWVASNMQEERGREAGTGSTGPRRVGSPATAARGGRELVVEEVEVAEAAGEEEVEAGTREAKRLDQLF